MKTRVIFASMILGLGLTISQADAATTTNTDDSPAANKPASTMLVNGSQKQFALYVEQNVAKLANTTNWQKFMSIITLYDHNPAAVLTVSSADRDTFNQAVAQVNNTLVLQKEATANRWMNQVNYTARMINFLWNIDQAAIELPDAQ